MDATIRVHRLDGKEFVVNADLIETVESTPDTVISLVSGRKLVVAESVDEIIQRVILFNRTRTAGGPLSELARPPVGRAGSVALQQGRSGAGGRPGDK